MNALTTVRPAEERTRLESIAVSDPNTTLDTGRFEQMQRVAQVMARSSLVPESLVCHIEGTGQGRVATPLPLDVAVANCFLIVNQSVRWNMDPFAVAQCCSIVHGRLMYEGKLVHAVIQAKLGESLDYEWNDKQGDAFGIIIHGPDSKRGKPRTIDGTVGRWKTTGTNSPWVKQPKLQLAYRGVREWVRLYEPALLLGVYTDDELESLQQIERSSAPRPLAGPPRSAPQIEAQPQAQQAAPPAADPGPAAPQGETGAADPGQAPRERGKPSAGRARRTKEEIAEDEAAERAEAEAEANKAAIAEREAQRAQVESQLVEVDPALLSQAQAGEDDQSRLDEDEEAQRQADQFAEIAKDAGESIEAAQDELALDQVAEELAGVDLPRSLRDQVDFSIEERRKRLRHQETLRRQEADAKAKIAEQEARARAPAIDRQSDAYKRGARDFANNVHKCLASAIRSDETALANWQAGHDEAREAGAR